MSSKIFPGRYESLAKIGEFVKHAAQEAGLDPRATYAVEAAVDEACSNIIEHAYGGEGKGRITCTCQVYPDRLMVVLHDKGKPFDPTATCDPCLDAPLEEQPGHGLGLFFMRNLMDNIHFEFDPVKGNRLTMIKYRQKKE